jgi:hypothetical protein
VALCNLVRSLENPGVGPEREKIEIRVRKPQSQLPQDGKEKDDVPDAVEFDEEDFPGLRRKNALSAATGKKGKKPQQWGANVTVHLPLKRKV